jgi:hypothetical protein
VGTITAAAAGGHLKGSYPDPTLAIPNALGAIIVGNGSDAVSLSPGTAGYVPVSDSTAFPATGIGYKKNSPVTGDSNVGMDRLVRLSSATGLPIPMTASKASLKDPGGLGVIVADATDGDARGTDAVDLQVNRPVTGASGVASGVQSVIAGGKNNKASAARAVVVGGDKNINSGSEGFIGGGFGNQNDSIQSSVVGGNTNTILGGAATEAFIGGGGGNSITASQSVIVGGSSNNVSADVAAILGGVGNIVSSLSGAILGGSGNQVTGAFSSISGGHQATANQYGQRAFSAGRFTSQADCQQSDVIWRISTTNATITEAFLDGGSAQFEIATNRSVAFDILIVARSSVGVTVAWKVVGAIKNNAGTTSLSSAVTTTVIGDGGGAAWATTGNVTVDADNPNSALRVRVTGAAATTIRWSAHGRMMELSS